MTVVNLDALAAIPTPTLRRLANSHLGDPHIQHAVDVELLARERQEELAAFDRRMTCAGPAEVHAAENRWCCLPGAYADAHRAILTAAEQRLQTTHELAGGGA